MHLLHYLLIFVNLMQMKLFIVALTNVKQLVITSVNAIININ